MKGYNGDVISDQEWSAAEDEPFDELDDMAICPVCGYVVLEDDRECPVCEAELW